jgi:oligoribonuclease NrnB/cAMP/cGMP phosphodiesterase (DHH superfamily)
LARQINRTRHARQIKVFFGTMAALPKPDVILTHESDLDGLLAGALLQKLAKKLFGTDIPLEAHHYNFWKQRELRERSAWVTDFTFEPRMDREDWVVIDHHVTEVVPKNARLIHDVNKSAGLLCYELCKQNGVESPRLDRIVHLNNVADLFLEDDSDFVIACDYANLVKIYQFWNLHTLIGGDIEKLLDHPLLEVMAVKRRIENPLGFEWSKSNITEISATIGFMDTIVGNNNLIVHQLLEQQATKYSVLVTLFRRGNAVFASFRSRNGEALRVAEKFQGGGHANAAGALLPKSVRNVPDGVEYLRQILNLKNETQQSRLNSLENLFASIEAGKK